MTPVDAILLAILQGLTEFLPVSSSGHLVLGEAILGAIAISNSIAFELVVHLGTFLAVILIFRKDIVDLIGNFGTHLLAPSGWQEAYNSDEKFKFSVLMIVAMLPAGIVGLLLRAQISTLFSEPFKVSLALLITGSLLLSTKYVKPAERGMNVKLAIAIGLAQALALIPGISRSGSTISTALLLGVRQDQAARFSFLMVLPLILAATALEFFDLIAVGISNDQMFILGIGLFVSFIVGYFSLKWLLKLLRQGQFHYFAWYCYLLAVVGILSF